MAKRGPYAISRWRELTFLIPNTTPTVYNLTYSLGDRSAGETFEREFIHGRAKLDLSGAYLSGTRLRGADLAHDNLAAIDLTNADLRGSRPLRVSPELRFPVPFQPDPGQPATGHPARGGAGTGPTWPALI